MSDSKYGATDHPISVSSGVSCKVTQCQTAIVDVSQKHFLSRSH